MFDIMKKKMGIKGISKILKVESPDCYKTILLKNVKSEKGITRVAIDAKNFMYQKYSFAYRDQVNETNVGFEEIDRKAIFDKFQEDIYRFIQYWINNDIIPVFIFDGPAPPEKKKTKDKRKEVRDKKAKQAKILLSQIKKMDPLKIPNEIIKEIKKCLIGSMFVRDDDFRRFYDIVYCSGFPAVISKGEADPLMASLAVNGYVHAVYTTDTDMATYGVPIQIKALKKNNQKIYAECVYLKEILSGLKLNQKKFTDLCIMMGCDYNTNMKRIGPKKSYKLIKEFDNIESLPEKFDISCLNHLKCRELFTVVPCSEFWLGFKSSSLNIRELTNENYENLKTFGVMSWRNNISASINSLILAEDVLNMNLSDDHDDDCETTHTSHK